MEIVSIFNLKGGVGKTTTTHSLASALRELGKKVLVIDIDPQSSLTFLITQEEPSRTTRDVLKSSRKLRECITEGEIFDYIGSTLELVLAEQELSHTWNRENALKEAFIESNIENDYDYCLIDCPPSMGVFSLNALTASHSLIIPCQCELLALQGMDILFQAIKVPMMKLNKNLKIRGIIPTLLSGRTKLSKEVYEMLMETYNSYNIFSPVRINSKLADIGIEKKSIFQIDKRSNGAKDYMTIAKEFIAYE